MRQLISWARYQLLDVRNRVALITGASMGIGAATARALAGAGCRVALVARSGDALAALADEIHNQHALDVGTGLRPQRMRGASPERVAQAILRAISREPRDAYATLFDRAYVTFSVLLPGVADFILRRYFANRAQH